MLDPNIRSDQNNSYRYTINECGMPGLQASGVNSQTERRKTSRETPLHQVKC